MPQVTDPALLQALNGGQPAADAARYGPPPVVDEAEAERIRIARQNADLQRDEFEYRQRRDAAKDANPSTPAQAGVAQRHANLEALTGQINRVQQLYNQNLRDEAIPLLGSLMEYLPTPTNRQFDSSAAGMAEQGMASFRVPGVGAQSDTELRQFVEANRPSASDSDAVIEEKLMQLRGRVDATRAAMGLPPAEWAGAGAAPAQEDDPAAAGTVAPSPPAGGAEPPADPQRPWSAPEQGVDAATGGTRTVQGDPQVAAEYRQRLASGQGAGEIIPWLRTKDVGPDTLVQAIEQIRYRDANPNVPIESYPVYSTREVPLSAFENAATQAGNFELPGGFSPGAYAIGAGQFLSGNTLDNMTGDPARARAAMEVSRANNPGSTFAGELSGGVLAALTGEAGLARMGMAGGLGRSLLADSAMGAANGAGAADEGNRLGGAIGGGLAAGAGSLAGTAATSGVARALTPTGGRLADLYAEGVRPSPGQRLSNANGGQGLAGLIGRGINAAEEGLQSVPIVGAAISGTRQEARNQFQTGAFNQALREIGTELPADAPMGTAAHRYTTEAFGEIYDRARSGMRLVADEELAGELAAVAERATLLAEPSINRFHSIVENLFTRRARNGGGELSGDAYKSAQSELGRIVAGIRNSPSGDGELADALEDLGHAMDQGARRSSPPEATALLDAADRGWARYIRIKEASRRVGGDAGEFTPAALDRAVQRESSGPRSEQYLRGEALMQEYATQGRSLSDRLPNSGTVDRALTVGGLGAGAAAFVDPTIATLFATIGGAYAPGVRRATTGAFAPSEGTRRAIAERLRRIERLTSVSTGAAGALAGTPGQ